MFLLLILSKETLHYLEKVSFILFFYLFRFYNPFTVPYCVIWEYPTVFPENSSSLTDLMRVKFETSDEFIKFN